MGKDPSYEFAQLLKAFETARVDREQGTVHTCKGFVHFVPSGQATVKVFLTEHPDFDPQRDQPAIETGE